MAARAIVVTDFKGDPQEAWHIVTKDKPKASAGNVVVRIKLRPVNPTDTLSPKLSFTHLQGKEVVIGSEGVGYVDEVGDGVTKVKKGQRVVPSFHQQFYRKGNGSWQDYVEVSEDEVFIPPESISDETAAQFIVNPWTAYGLLKDQDIPKGEYLIQNAAGSVLGRQLIQLAKHWGVKTINVVRRDDLRDELKTLGADEVINSSTEDVVARVKEITGGKMAAGALDAVAGKSAKSSKIRRDLQGSHMAPPLGARESEKVLNKVKVLVSSVKDGGKVFTYGFLGTNEHDVLVDVFDLGRVEHRIWRYSNFIQGGKRIQEVAGAVSKLIEDKVIVPLAGKIFKFADFKAALLEADKAGRGGKVLISDE